MGKLGDQTKMQQAPHGELGECSRGGLMTAEQLHRYAWAMGFADGQDVLDVWCSEGYGTFLLCSVARSAVGVDFRSDLIHSASAAYVAPNLSYTVGEAARLPLDDSSVDLVISFETLDSVADHEAFIGEAARVLREGGLLVLSTQNPPERQALRNEGRLKPGSELPLADVERALRAHFPHVEFLGQSTSLDSHILPLESTSGAEATAAAFDVGQLVSLRAPDRPTTYLAVASKRVINYLQSSILAGYAVEVLDSPDALGEPPAVHPVDADNSIIRATTDVRSLTENLLTIIHQRGGMAELGQKVASRDEAPGERISEIQIVARDDVDETLAWGERQRRALEDENARLIRQLAQAQDISQSVTELLEDAMLLASDFRARLHDKEAEVEGVRREIESIYMSRSWRLTRYARRVGSLLRRL